MPIDKWPCNPTDFQSILPDDLPHFLQAGLNHVLNRAVSILDPHSHKRFDSFNRFDEYQPFCYRLRRGDENVPVCRDLDRNCTNCDLYVANHLVSQHAQTDASLGPLIRYRCYLGLEELATVISVGGLKVMVVSGQFMPETGPADIKAALHCVGRRAPDENEVSQEFWTSIKSFQFPNDLWINAEAIANSELEELSCLADKLQPINEGFEAHFMKEANRIQEIAQRYYEMAKAKVEANILWNLVLSLSGGGLNSNHQVWDGANKSLEILNEKLDIQFSAFFSGMTEGDTLTHHKASAGKLPSEFSSLKNIHFNWRKAGLKTEDGRDTATQVFSWLEIGLDHTETLRKGLRGISNREDLFSALIPVKLPKGPFGMLMLGPHNQHVDLGRHETFILSTCRDLCTRILTLQLSNILAEDLTNWERTAKLSGHRVRSSLQSIGSQLKTIKAVNDADPAFTNQDRLEAEADLDIAFKNLTELSYAAESSSPGTLDVKSVKRDLINISQVIWDAISTQQDLADLFGIEVDVSQQMHALNAVLVNYTLARSAFINLINNGLKYSYPRPRDRKRIFRIKPSFAAHSSQEVWIELVNYGLGVKQEDREKIFEWGVRLSEGDTHFKEVYGKGIGLWEAKHIIEGHGGRIFVTSTHFSKAPVTDQNITQCITVFTVVLPAAETCQFTQGRQP